RVAFEDEEVDSRSTSRRGFEEPLPGQLEPRSVQCLDEQAIQKGSRQAVLLEPMRELVLQHPKDRPQGLSTADAVDEDVLVEPRVELILEGRYCALHFILTLRDFEIHGARPAAEAAEMVEVNHDVSQ